MKTGKSKKILSVFLAVLTVLSMALPGLTAFAAEIDEGGGVIGVYDIEIFTRTEILFPPMPKTGSRITLSICMKATKSSLHISL